MKVSVKDEATPFLKSMSVGFPRLVRAFSVKVGIGGANAVQDEAESISATNQLQQSIDHNIQPDGVAILGANYAINALEIGTPPGTMPNIYALKRWAKSKGIKEGLVYAIAKTIKASGSRKHRQGGPKQLSKAGQKIEKIIEKEIDVFLSQLLSQ